MTSTPSPSDSPVYDQTFWQALWTKTLRDSADKVAHRPPNAHLLDAIAELPPGKALDAGCGHGAEALWMATRGWDVTGVDFSEAALAHARSMADAAGAQMRGRAAFEQGDLARWEVRAGHYDLVASLYVHIPIAVDAMITRLAQGVAPGGRLFLVGHQPTCPATGAETRAAGQVQVSAAAARAALDTSCWRLIVAEDRPTRNGIGVDAVIFAERLA